MEKRIDDDLVPMNPGLFEDDQTCFQRHPCENEGRSMSQIHITVCCSLVSPNYFMNWTHFFELLRDF